MIGDSGREHLGPEGWLHGQLGLAPVEQFERKPLYLKTGQFRLHKIFTYNERW